MGCVEGAGPSSGTSDTKTAAPAGLRGSSAREVEAPDVYQVTDSALWDGRPSLGGIWVAAPDVVDPERVVILNPATGKSVTGALFRRERDNPGPPLQVSSDAAEALGILAGQPTSLRVTALRRPAEPAAAAPAEGTAVAAAEPSTATAPEGANDPAAAETAALATAALAATAAAATDAGTATEAAVDGTAEVGAEVAATEPPKKKTWKERRAEAKAKREADKAAKAAASAAAAGTAAPADAPAATADEAAVATVETAPLDARSPEVAAAAEAASGTASADAPEPEKKTRRQIREEQEAAKAAAAAAAEAAAAAPAPDTAAAPAGGAARSIQIASFSKEENAKRAVEALAKVSVTAQVRRSEQGGKVVWGVLTTGDDAQLSAIKKAGFADAFFLD
jgi:hypothetical protein